MLRALATSSVVAAVASIGVAAAVDALRAEERPGHEPAHGRPSAAHEPPSVRAQLRAAGVHGTLVYADRGCRIHALRLPSLERTAVPQSAGGPVQLAGTVAASCEISEPPAPRHRPTFLVRDGNLIQLGRRRAAQITLPGGLPEAHAVAWSPDQRWLALATRASIWLFPLEEPGRPLIRLPFQARDVAWRPSQYP